MYRLATMVFPSVLSCFPLLPGPLNCAGTTHPHRYFRKNNLYLKKYYLHTSFRRAVLIYHESPFALLTILSIFMHGWPRWGLLVCIHVHESIIISRNVSSNNSVSTVSTVYIHFLSMMFGLFERRYSSNGDATRVSPFNSVSHPIRNLNSISVLRRWRRWRRYFRYLYLPRLVDSNIFEELYLYANLS